MAHARDVDIQGLTFREAAARMVAVRTEEVFEHFPRALDMDDPEGVHDTRVATRRLRAVLEICAPCFPKRPHRKLLREVKALADVLGERRDPDVAGEFFRGVAEELTVADRPGIESLLQDIERERREANAHLRAAIEQVRADCMHERLLALSAAAVSA